MHKTISLRLRSDDLAMILMLQLFAGPRDSPGLNFPIVLGFSELFEEDPLDS